MCTYTPEEEFFKEIEQLDGKNFSISLDSYDEKDIIFLEGPAEFTYNIGSGNGDV